MTYRVWIRKVGQSVKYIQVLIVMLRGVVPVSLVASSLCKIQLQVPLKSISHVPLIRKKCVLLKMIQWNGENMQRNGDIFSQKQNWIYIPDKKSEREKSYKLLGSWSWIDDNVWQFVEQSLHSFISESFRKFLKVLCYFGYRKNNFLNLKLHAAPSQFSNEFERTNLKLVYAVVLYDFLR
jgi:hypothetical protein